MYYVCLDINVCAAWMDYWVRVSYHDRDQLLRRDDHHRQGNADQEGIARYGHQGGGQKQAGQGIVSWKRIIQEEKKRSE